MIVAKQIFSLNEQGKRRNNEDNIYPPKGSANTSDKLFIVCDGVGGETKGEVASEMVCTAINQYISKQQLPLSDGHQTIENAILFANSKLAEYITKDVAAERMSTTLTLILMNQQSVIAAWCGDTRIHHIRDGRVLWKSDDHSLVHELVRNGEISQAEARTHPRRNVITRCLNGQNVNNKVDFHEITGCKADDFFLLCTDGFLEQVDEQVLYEVLNDDQTTDKGKYFLQLCEGKTKDNFSMYLVKIAEATAAIDMEEANAEAEVPPVVPIFSKNRWRLALLAMIIGIACITILFIWRRKNGHISQEDANPQELIRKNSVTTLAAKPPFLYQLSFIKT
ncbi:MAG: protein phosphatase 2C domain-containing protein [Bacteroidota bacterium]